MEDKELIDKEFEFFKYESVNHLNWEDNFEKYIGARCKVLNVNPGYNKQFVRCQVYPSIGTMFIKHFPRELVIDQIEKAEYDSKSTEELLNDMKQLISRI